MVFNVLIMSILEKFWIGKDLKYDAAFTHPFEP